MTTTIKITELTNIGANLASSTVIPVVNMAGTPTTEKAVLGNVANLVLAGAGGNYVAAAVATTATTANTVLTNAQPNITSMGNLTGLTVSNATGIVNFSNTANVTLGNVSNLHIAGGTIGQILSTDGAGNLSWASDTTTYGNSNVVTLLSAFGSNTITTTGNVSVGNISGNGRALFGIAGANISGFVPNANVANTAFAVAAANVSGLGNIATINLTGNSSNVLYGNGVFAAVAGGANTANVTFDDVTVQGVNGFGLNLSAGPEFTANLAYLQVRSGDVASHIHMDTGNNEAYDLIIGDDQKFVQVSSTGNIIMSSYDGNVSYAMTLDTTGDLTVPGSITRPIDDPLILVTSGSNGNSSSISIDGEFGRTLLRTNDGSTLQTWEFDIAGNLELPTNGSLNLTGGGISQASNETLLITAFDNDGVVNSSLELSPNSTLTRIEQWSDQDSNSWTTSDWATGTYTIQGGQGAVIFTGATNMINFLNSLQGVGHIYFSVNGGPQLLWDGSGGSSTNITFYTPTYPATNPTTVTSFDYYYSYKSGFEIDYDSNEINIYANDADINLQTTGQRDISLDSSRDVTISANSSSTWTFDTTGNLSLPGDIIGPASANFTIYSNAAVHEFIFGDDGTFYAPDNVVMSGNSIALGPGADTLGGLAHAVLVASSNHFAYIQGAIHNVSDNGSADWVAQGAKGDDDGGWADLGFTSSGFSDGAYTITGGGDGYVFVQTYGPNSIAPFAGGGNLILATGDQGTTKDIIFGTGGFLTSNIFGRISNANNSFELSRAGATITFPDATEQSTAYISPSITGNWTLASGVNTVSISVPGSGTYSIWVNGNIPNGIVTYTATAVVTNTNVPVLGEQYGWFYEIGNALVLTSIPNQFVGTQGAISNATPYLGNTANVFTFGITNNSGNTAVVNYGYTKL
jgi:hypothetical protein